MDYDYVGSVPDFKYYDKIKTLEEYSKIALQKNWNLKFEATTYCEQDCKTLYYAIKEFSKEIYKEFTVDISQTPTISSLAFRIFRLRFLNEKNNISNLKGSIYDFIYQGYYGGAVDAYIPSGQNIKCYDVNSLYPSSMKINPMPVGSPHYFEGNVLEFFNKINFNYPSDEALTICSKFNTKFKSYFDLLNEIFEIKNLKEFNSKIIKFLNLEKISGVLGNKDNLPYGFFEVKVETPPKDEVNHPILLKKHKTGSVGIRTIAAVGNWTGVYFSEELYNAVKLNNKHKFKVKCGFLFRSEFIFKDYVEKLYKLKENSETGSPIYAISKLLLNSLFGRFGMKPDLDQHIIYDGSSDQNNSEIENLFLKKNGWYYSWIW